MTSPRAAGPSGRSSNGRSPSSRASGASPPATTRSLAMVTIAMTLEGLSLCRPALTLAPALPFLHLAGLGRLWRLPRRLPLGGGEGGRGRRVLGRCAHGIAFLRIENSGCWRGLRAEGVPPVSASVPNPGVPQTWPSAPAGSDGTGEGEKGPTSCGCLRFRAIGRPRHATSRCRPSLWVPAGRVLPGVPVSTRAVLHPGAPWRHRDWT